MQWARCGSHIRLVASAIEGLAVGAVHGPAHVDSLRQNASAPTSSRIHSVFQIGLVQLEMCALLVRTVHSSPETASNGIHCEDW